MLESGHSSIDSLIDVFDPSKSNLHSKEMISLLDSLSGEVMKGNTPEFLKFLGKMESDSRLKARVSGYNTDPSKGKVKTASGIYQFTKPTVESTKRSAKTNVGFDEAYIDAISDDPTKWNLEQSNIMALAKLFPAIIEGHPGLVDSLLKSSFKSNYDKNAWERVYGDSWHTDVDSPTQKRLDKILKKY